MLDSTSLDRPGGGGGCSRLFLQLSFLLFLVDIKVYIFCFLAMQRRQGL